MKKIITLLTVLIIALSSVLPVYAADGKVTYSGNAGNSVFEPGSEHSLTDLFPNFKGVMPGDTLTEQVEITVKYEGYIQRQMQDVKDLQRMESRPLPEDIDYHAIQGLRLEAREKLTAIRPLNIGQAGRISGVSPADVAALMIYLEK